MLFRSTAVFMPGVWCEFFIYYTQGLSKQVFLSLGFPGGTSGKEPACRRHKRCRFSPRVRKIPWRTAWQPTPVFLPWESYGQRSLAGYIVHEVTRSQTWLKWLRMHTQAKHSVEKTLKLYPELMENMLRISWSCLSWALELGNGTPMPPAGQPTSRPPILWPTFHLINIRALQSLG